MFRRNNRLVNSLQLTVYRARGLSSFSVLCLLFSVLCLLFSVFSSPSYAADNLPKEPIEVNGDKVEYFHEKKEVAGSGNILITYKDVVLTCDKVIVYLDRQEAVAEGNVKVTQKDAYFSGDSITYNFNSRQGSISNGYLNAKPFYGKAKEIDKVAYKDQYNMGRGYVTTCELEKPHYRIQARKVKVYLGDRIEARDILFFIGDIPVMYLPYYVQPIRDMKTHITIMPGRSSDWGYYALGAYRYYLNDENRGDVLLDYRTKKGLGEGINHYYKTKELGDGSLKFYYTHENDKLAYDRTGDMKARHRFQARHRWELGENTDTTAILELNEMSDIDMIKDYFYYEYEELGNSPDNYISVITQKEDYSTQLLIRKRLDNFLTVVERLPEYSIDIPNYRITQGLPIYFKASASGVYLNKTFDKTTYLNGQEDLGVIRLDNYDQLSYAAKFFRSLSITPYGGVRNTYYSRNKWGDTNQIRTIFNAGVDNSIKFYRTFDVETDAWGLDIHKLRHIITPTANYYYTHQPTISPDNLNQFDSIDSISATNGVLLSLENKLQTKRYVGGSLKSVDLATFIVSSDYQFTLKDNNHSYKSQKFKSVDFKLELAPYPWLYALAEMSVDTKRKVIQNESIDLVASGSDKWSLGISNRYENVTTGRSNLVTLDGIYKINDKWKVRAYERVDLRKGFDEQEYTIFRDLHCWIAEFTINMDRQTNSLNFWLTFRLKAFPEYQIGLRRTYSRPRFGSIGEESPQGGYSFTAGD